MIAMKAFLEGVEGACPDVAENHTQGTDNQYKGCILEGIVIGFRVGRGKIGVIEKFGYSKSTLLLELRKTKIG